jgi:ABC-type polar amino acid transport system ATPase subunit
MMDKGGMIEEADPETFFSAPDHERTRQFLAHME